MSLRTRGMNVMTAKHGKGETKMSIFTIDSDNNITALTALPAGADQSQSFSNAKELGKLTAEWPASRQLRGRRSVRRAETRQEVHQPQGWGRADLAGGNASITGRRATNEPCRSDQRKGEEVPGQGHPARRGAEVRNRSAHEQDQARQGRGPTCCLNNIAGESPCPRSLGDWTSDA